MPELPPPLPPGERTVIQLVAETIRAYGARFWRVLPLGLPVAVATQISLGRSDDLDTVALLALAPAFALAFVVACRLVVGGRITATSWAIALAIFLPVPILERFYVLPALAWLALFGLSVPAVMVEQLGFRDAFARGRRLAAADYVHALGSICTLAILVFLSERTLIVLLRTQSENSARAAYLLADIVLSPMLYVGGALLYFDQAARIGVPLVAGDPA
jgi:purine-cytosine permease-like protein